MALKKNDICEMVIDDMGSEGEGIGKVDGFTLFVKDALIGDRIEVKVIKTKKNYGYGRLMRMIEPSPCRVEPRCANARACGGCQLQHMRYEAQLQFKQNKVANLLARVGKVTDYEMLPIIGMDEPYNYRNKAQIPVGKNREGEIVTGFYAGRTHTIIDTEDCCIQHPLNGRIVRIVKAWMRENHIEPYDEVSGSGLVRHIVTRVGAATGEVMVCLVINGDHLPHAAALTESLRSVPGLTSISVNINTKKTNVILGPRVKTLFGRGYIEDEIGNVRFRISPLSFYQVNPVQTRALYGKVLEFAELQGNETVWDLYCGIGTISLFLARFAGRVRGVEITPQAIADARVNAGINHIQNVRFFAGKSEEILPQMYEKTRERADVIVVDPPRKGCAERLLSCIAEMRPDRIIYVSCDPATLARDLRYLEEHGFKVEKVQCVDMFAMGVGVETVVSLRYQNPRDCIHVTYATQPGDAPPPKELRVRWEPEPGSPSARLKRRRPSRTPSGTSV